MESSISTMSRWQASFIHLLISLGILAALIIVIQFIWYPNELINFGGWQGIKIVAAIDIVLGPLLTLIIFNSKKALKELRTDLTVIGLIQIGALTYGCWTVYSERPIVQVLDNSGLHIISASVLKERDISIESLRDISENGTPPFSFYLYLPKSLESVARAQFLYEYQYGVPLTLNTGLYKNFPAVTAFPVHYLNDFKYDASAGCHIVPVISQQLEGRNVCLNTENGDYSLAP